MFFAFLPPPAGAGPLRALGINYNEGRGVRESVGGVGIVVELVAQDMQYVAQFKVNNDGWRCGAASDAAGIR